MNNFKFKIAGQEINVKFVSSLNDGTSFGDFSSIQNCIRIALKIKEDGVWYDVSQSQIKNTLWHEIFHCFQYFWTNETDEDFAQVLANFMCEYEQTKEEYR